MDKRQKVYIFNFYLKLKYCYLICSLGKPSKTSQNGLQSRSSKNGMTAVWHYGLKLQWYLTGDKDWWNSMVWYEIVGLVWYGGVVRWLLSSYMKRFQSWTIMNYHRGGGAWLTWMTDMDDGHRWLAWMTGIDDWHWWLALMTGIDYWHGWLAWMTLRHC